MHRALCFTAVCCLLTSAGAPADDGFRAPWWIIRGGPTLDESWAVDTDSAGDVYWATHQTLPGQGAAIHLYKLTPDGEEIWSSSWSGNWNNQAYVVTVREPYVYVGGATWRGFGWDSVDMAVVCFTTTAGDSVWDFTWDQGHGYEEVDGLVVDDDAIYVSGWTTGEETEEDLALLKLSPDGQEVLWTRTWGFDGRDVANGELIGDDQNVYAAGYTDGDALLMAFSKETGDSLWLRTWGGFFYDEAYGMTGNDAHLYTVGVTSNFGSGAQIFLLKYDKLGNLVWQRIMGGSASESARALALTADDHVLVAGKSTSYGNGDFDLVVFKYSAEGDSLWYKRWGGPEADEAHGIRVAGDEVYIAGETFSYGQGQNDALLIKTNTACDFPATVHDPPAVAAPIRLEPIRPNPFHATTRIRFSLSRPARVSLHIIDPLGRKVATLWNGDAAAGAHAATWRAAGLPVGTYICRLAGSGAVESTKLTVVR